MIIRIKLNNLKNIFVEMLPNETILDLKRLIFAEYGQNYLNYNIYLNNQLLSNDTHFKDLEYTLESSLEFFQTYPILKSQSSEFSSFKSSFMDSQHKTFHHISIPYPQIQIDQIRVQDSNNPPSPQNQSKINLQNSKIKSNSSNQFASNSTFLPQIAPNLKHSETDFDKKVQRLLRLNLSNKKQIETILRSCGNDYDAALKKLRNSKKSMKPSEINSRLKKLPPNILKIYEKFDSRAKKSIKTIISRGHDLEFSIKLFESFGCDEEQTISFLESA